MTKDETNKAEFNFFFTYISHTPQGLTVSGEQGTGPGKEQAYHLILAHLVSHNILNSLTEHQK